MNQPETPESLLQFFSSLDPGDPDGEQCQIHYGCLCVLRKGRLAAEMLIAAQGKDGAGSGEPDQSSVIGQSLRACSSPSVSEGFTPPPDFSADLAAEKAKNQEIIKQNLKLVDENVQLKEKIRALQRQINRLYDIQELRAIERSLQPAAGEPDGPKTNGQKSDSRAEDKNLAKMVMELDGAARIDKTPEKTEDQSPREE